MNTTNNFTKPLNDFLWEVFSLFPFEFDHFYDNTVHAIRREDGGENVQCFY